MTAPRSMTLSELEQRRSHAERGVDKTRSILAKLRSALAEPSNATCQESIHALQKPVHDGEELNVCSQLPELHPELHSQTDQNQLEQQVSKQQEEIRQLRLENEQLRSQQNTAGEVSEQPQLGNEHGRAMKLIRDENENLNKQLCELSAVAATVQLDVKQQQFQANQLQQLLKCLAIQRDVGLMLRFVYSWSKTAMIAAHEQGVKLLESDRSCEEVQPAAEEAVARERLQLLQEENEHLTQQLNESSAALAASELQCSVLQSKVTELSGNDDSEVSKGFQKYSKAELARQLQILRSELQERSASRSGSRSRPPSPEIKEASLTAVAEIRLK